MRRAMRCWVLVVLALATTCVALAASAALPVIGSFTTSRASVVAAQTATLAWSVSGATTLTIDQGVGDVTGIAAQAAVVAPTASTRYTLTATNASGSVTASVRVDFIALVQRSAEVYHTEHALFMIADPAQVTFPAWSSVYSNANVASYVATLNAQFPDDYLMVVVAANNLSPATVPNVLTVRHIADGIGQNSITGVGVPNVCRYHIGTSPSLIEPVFAVFDHEIGHNFGVQIGIELGSGHWNVDTTVTGQMASTYSDDGYATVKQIAGNPVSGFTWSTVDNLARNETELFADQDLYAMGLHAVFPDTYAFANTTYNPDQTLGYSAITKYDHAWAVQKNGPRIPAYTASPKQFRLGFVYVARDLAEIQSVYAAVERSIVHFENAEAVDTTKFRFQVPFLVETKFRASVNARLADLDGNTRPTLALTGASYVVSTDGTATFPFTAADADGTVPVVSIVPASANASVAGGNVVVQGLAIGTHFFTVKAEDGLGKKAFAHFVVDVVTPGVYAFAPQAGLAPGTVVTSNTVTVAGLAAPAPIAVSGGTYSRNGGPFTAVSGLVFPGDSVALRQTAAATPGTTTAATLMVGYASGAFNATTAAGLPGAPTGVVATSGNAQASVTFVPPASDGGSAIAGYTVTSNPSGGIDGSAGMTSATHVITGLTNGTPYTFTVVATNAQGNGPASAPSNTVIPQAAVPGAPQSVTATAGNAQAVVTFTAPSSDGGAAITGYTVVSLPAGGLDAQAGTLATTHTMTGLVNGTAYAFRATATNAVGTGAMSAASNTVTPVAPAGGSARVLRDFDGDGRSDLLWRHNATGQSVVWLMQGGTVADAGTLLVDPAWAIGQAARFDGGNRTDLMWKNASSGAVVLWLMNGKSAASGALLAADPAWVVTHVADFNGDGRSDVLWRNASTGEVVMWLMDGFTILGGARVLLDPAWQVTHVADFDGDGKADLLWRNGTTGATVMWLMNGVAPTAGATLLTSTAWSVTHVGDLNGDGRADLVWSNASTGDTAAWVMNGTALMSGAGLLADANWTVQRLADLDGDGKADIVWRNGATGELAAWLMNGATLRGGGRLLLDPAWTLVTTGDYDGDGKDDLVLRNVTTGETVMWLMNGVAPAAGYTLVNDAAWTVVP